MSQKEYVLPEALLKECKKSFDFFDLGTSGRINSGLILEYLSTIGQPNMIHYLLEGIEHLGGEIKYEDYLKHVREKLKQSHNEEFYKKVAGFVDLAKGKDIEIEGLKRLAQELGIDLSEFEVEEVLEMLKRIENSD